MKKNSIILVAFLIALIVVGLGSFLLYKHTSKQNIVQKLTKFTVALDWTPNTNHTGMYVALAKGWYKQEGLDVTILPYSSNASSDILVSTGKADVGIGATEGILTDAATGTPVVSIAGIIAHNTSGFITLTSDNIKSPKDFDNKIYGGGGTPAESAIVGAIIKKDGGKGVFQNVSLDVEAMQALETKKVDFVWVFEGWEVIQAKRQGYNVTYFPSVQYGIPDYYTPNIITSPTEIKTKPELLKKFMVATQKGYDYAIANPTAAAQILISSNPKGTFPDEGFIIESQKFLSAHYKDAKYPWGYQQKAMWHNYPQFLIDAKAVLDSNNKPVTSLNLDNLYTNQFIQ